MKANMVAQVKEKLKRAYSLFPNISFMIMINPISLTESILTGRMLIHWAAICLTSVNAKSCLSISTPMVLLTRGSGKATCVMEWEIKGGLMDPGMKGCGKIIRLASKESSSTPMGTSMKASWKVGWLMDSELTLIVMGPSTRVIGGMICSTALG